MGGEREALRVHVCSSSACQRCTAPPCAVLPHSSPSLPRPAPLQIKEEEARRERELDQEYMRAGAAQLDKQARLEPPLPGWLGACRCLPAAAAAWRCLALPPQRPLTRPPPLCAACRSRIVRCCWSV